MDAGPSTRAASALLDCQATSPVPLSNYKNIFWFLDWWDGSAVNVPASPSLSTRVQSLEPASWKERTKPVNCSQVSTWLLCHRIPIFLLYMRTHRHRIKTVCVCVFICSHVCRQIEQTRPPEAGAIVSCELPSMCDGIWSSGRAVYTQAPLLVYLCPALVSR